jgi:lipopolysaccharide/colanic/teichoic acid biosynthesis glycosyltransferase
VKRTADVVASALLLLLTAPLFAIVAVLVRTTSHGPVFHRQPDVGPRERTIDVLTFRTRVDGAGTASHARMRAVVGADDAFTPVGRQLARLRLDRLPRLLNLLRGDASLFS